MRSYLLGWAIAVALVPGATTVAHAATTATSISVDTGPLIDHSAGPFTLLFAMTDGSGIGDANNTVTIGDIDLGGGAALAPPTVVGGASGDAMTVIVINDTAFLNFFTQSFRPGTTLRFTITATNAEEAGGIPDRITFAILDRFGTPIATRAPGGDFLVGFDLSASSATLEAFPTDPSRPPAEGDPISIDAPVLASDTTPP